MQLEKPGSGLQGTEEVANEPSQLVPGLAPRLHSNEAITNLFSVRIFDIFYSNFKLLFCNLR